MVVHDGDATADRRRRGIRPGIASEGRFRDGGHADGRGHLAHVLHHVVLHASDDVVVRNDRTPDEPGLAQLALRGLVSERDERPLLDDAVLAERWHRERFDGETDVSKGPLPHR
jgi:hypothetical protein